MDPQALIKKIVNKRKHTRFSPDPNTMALIDFENHDSLLFKPTRAAFVVDESYQGARLLLATADSLPPGMRFKVKVGHLHPMPAEIRWSKQMGTHSVVLGLMYLGF